MKFCDKLSSKGYSEIEKLTILSTVINYDRKTSEFSQQIHQSLILT